METTEVIIARLVLGYLKEEKCRSAYKEFIKTSEYLQSELGTKAKYLPTRFVGLTLADILCEYFELSKIVQGRLEATNYYNECHSRSSLVQQLLYLLNKVQSSRTSTPCPRSPLESNLDETSPSHIDHVSDVETTPAHTLPGNVRCTSEDSYLYKTPSRRKSNSKLNKSATVANLQISEKEDMSEVLANTLLENKEFHEKIAQTINKVAEKQYRMTSELDQTIKTVVKETEADPIFDKILEEIIGSTSAIENSKGIDTSSTTSSTAKDTREDLRNKSKRTQKRLNSDHSEEDLDQRVTMPCNPQTVEQQNDEAIRSIVANSNLVENTQEMCVNNEVTVFNGSLDKYLTSNTCHANTQTQPLQNPLYINTTGGLLMVPSAIPTSGNLQIDSTKHYYFVNKQSTVNWNIPPIQTTNIITEQDILAMPTVIVSEERQNKMPTTEPALQTPILKTTSKLQKIAPKPTIQIAHEYFNRYNANDSQQQSGLKNVVYPKTTKKPKTKEKTVETISSQTVTKPDAEDITNANKSLPDEHKQDGEDKTSHSLQTIDKTNGGHLTPPPAVERVQKTPKSASHIRNLDFSTPPKITSTQKKSFQNSNAFVHKKQAAKLKERRTWDSDLRASILNSEEEKASNISKKKKKTPIKKVKKKVKTTKVVKKNLNRLEQNAALIEAALQTPVKTENENCTKSETVNNDKVKENDENKNNAENSNNAINSESDNILKREVSETLECQAKDSIECNSNKTILSPSKLKANKRKLIKSDVIEDTANDTTKPGDETNKFITPEMVKDNFHYPIKANRNITSLFETPLKNEFIPKTPGSPSASLNTPFTKMLEANLKGIDISSLPTPSIPITPNFPPFTPNVEISSPYSNRPTDYSTSSSYYHPSDSEPNRSLEANVIELEKQTVTPTNDVTKNVEKDEMDKRDHQNVLVQPVDNSLHERIKMFNINVIGKKNLSLVNRNIQSSSSDSSSDSSNEDDNIDSCDWVEKSNETIIYNKKTPETPKRTYSLRNRTTTVKREDITKALEVKETNIRQTNKNMKSTAKSINNSILKPVESQICNKSELSGETQSTDNKVSIKEEQDKNNENNLIQQTLKKELNEKLMRTVKKIKTVEKPQKRNGSQTTKNSNSKFMKIKFVSKTKKKGKSKKSPKKNVAKGTKNMRGATSINLVSEPKAKRKGGKNKKDTTPTKKPEQIDKSASDIEAQNLIEGLKERGIHLMKNKSPNKKTNETSNFTEHDKNFYNESVPANDVILNNSTEESPHERSTSELETEWRETYDTAAFDEYECVIFSESKKITKSFESYNTKVLKKTFIGRVFIDEINEAVDIPLEVTPFCTLLDIPPSRNQAQKQKAKRNKEEDVKEEVTTKDATEKTETNKNEAAQNLISSTDNTSYTTVVTSREDRDGLEAPSLKKRKVEKEEGRMREECQNLLQQINVDTFLNNIYGNS